MKKIADLTPNKFSADHLTQAINYARIRGRLRRADPGFRPSRTKSGRLKVRLRSRTLIDRSR